MREAQCSGSSSQAAHPWLVTNQGNPSRDWLWCGMIWRGMVCSTCMLTRCAAGRETWL